MRVGYKIIDLKEKNLVMDGDAVHIPGVYDSIEGNYYKAQLLTGLVIDGVEKPDRFVTFGIQSGTTYDAMLSISAEINVLMLHVTDEDMVSITSH